MRVSTIRAVSTFRTMRPLLEPFVLFLDLHMEEVTGASKGLSLHLQLVSLLLYLRHLLSPLIQRLRVVYIKYANIEEETSPKTLSIFRNR